MEAIASDSAASSSRAREPSGSSAPPFALTLALFVLSGATGLVDQLCFSKYLSYIVGSTAYAVSAVLAFAASFADAASPRSFAFAAS